MIMVDIDKTEPTYMIQLLKSLWLNNEGQDMIEYALLASTLVVVVAGFLPPSIMPSVSTIFSKISGYLGSAPN